MMAMLLHRRIFAAREDPKTQTWMSEEIAMGNESICNNALRGDIPKHILSFGEDESGKFDSFFVFCPFSCSCVQIRDTKLF